VVSALSAGNNVTAANLLAAHDNKPMILEDAVKVTAVDAEVGDVCVLPNTPTNEAGLLTASPESIIGTAGRSEFVILRLQENNAAHAGPNDLVAQVLMYTGPVGVFGIVGTVVVLPNVTTLIRVAPDIAAGLIAVYEAKLAHPPGIPQQHQQQAPPGKPQDRQEFQHLMRLEHLFTPDFFRTALFPGVEAGAPLTSSMISTPAALLSLDQRVTSIFGVSLMDEISVPPKDLKALVFFQEFNITSFVPAFERRDSYSVNDYVRMFHRVARLMEGVYTPEVITCLKGMVQALADFLSPPNPSDCSTVGKAMMKLFSAVPAYILAHPDTPPVQAVQELWHITRTSHFTLDCNAQFIIQATRSLSAQIGTMSVRQSSQRAAITRDRGPPKPHQGGGAGKRSADTTVSPEMQEWIKAKPPGIADMNPQLCSNALLDTCPRRNCRYEHDIDKVPEEQRSAVRDWLTSKPRGKSNKKNRVR
jgi:hypothetical protein